MADLSPKFLSDKTSSRLEYLHIEQSDDADRVVCNDAGVFQPGGGVYSVGGSLPIVNSTTLQLVQSWSFDFVPLSTRIYRAVVAFGHSALLFSLPRHSAPLQAYYLCEGGLDVVFPIFPSTRGHSLSWSSPPTPYRSQPGAPVSLSLDQISPPPPEQLSPISSFHLVTQLLLPRSRACSSAARSLSSWTS